MGVRRHRKEEKGGGRFNGGRGETLSGGVSVIFFSKA